MQLQKMSEQGNLCGYVRKYRLNYTKDKFCIIEGSEKQAFYGFLSPERRFSLVLRITNAFVVFFYYMP